MLNSYTKIFTFDDQELVNTAESTPDSSGNSEKPQLVTFRNQILPDSKIARELHEASIQSHWYGETPKEYVDKRIVKLKKQKFEKVVVLDLDETLIYHKNNQTLVRPFCLAFLERLSRICTLVLFTAAKQDHAIKMLKLQIQIKIFQSYLHIRTHDRQCQRFENFQTDLKDIVIVENSPKIYVFSSQQQVHKSIMAYRSYLTKANKMIISLNYYFHSQKQCYWWMMYAFNQQISLNYKTFIKNQMGNRPQTSYTILKIL